MTNKKKHKIYTPPKRHNIEVLAKKVESQQKQVDDITNVLSAVINANEQHVNFLSNFVQHDMKNAIHSMDGILSTATKNLLTDEIQVLKTSLDLLRQTISNFANVIPHSQNGEFSLVSLLSSVEALSRSNLNKNNVQCIFDYDRNSSVLINQSYQALLQVLHNIVINASKAMEDVSIKEMHISANISDEWCEINIADTGIPIPKEDLEKIFTYGFSTTGGTGIGLFHARYVCDSFKGEISVNTNCKSPINKEFIIKFPTKKQIQL
jgi:signal transduction histidine kinase